MTDYEAALRAAHGAVMLAVEAAIVDGRGGAVTPALADLVTLAKAVGAVQQAQDAYLGLWALNESVVRAKAEADRLAAPYLEESMHSKREAPMTQYRKKPVVVEAFEMTQERRNDNRDWPEWLNRAWQMEDDETGALLIDQRDPDRQKLCIFTPEGIHYVDWGDWIIPGVEGEIYLCKPDIFEATYEEVR